MKFDHREMLETLILSEGVQVKYKDESTFMKFLGFLCRPFNSRFMLMTTTFSRSIYFPSRKWVEEDHYRAWRILCHELVHVEDHQKEGVLFSIKYSMPQGLAVLALLSLLFQSWWPLLCLLFLAPIPAPWRTKAEMRGYAMSMAVGYWLHGGGIPLAQKEKIASYFTGPL